MPQDPHYIKSRLSCYWLNIGLLILENQAAVSTIVDMLLAISRVLNVRILQWP